MLKQYFEASLGFVGIWMAMVMLQGALYGVSMLAGDIAFPFLANVLAFYCIRFGLKMEGFAFSGFVSMCLTFGMTTTFAAASWYLRSMFFDLQQPFYGSTGREIAIALVILPLVLLSILSPPFFKIVQSKRPEDAQGETIFS